MDDYIYINKCMSIYVATSSHTKQLNGEPIRLCMRHGSRATVTEWIPAVCILPIAIPTYISYSQILLSESLILFHLLFIVFARRMVVMVTIVNWL